MNAIFRFTHNNLPKEFRPLACPPLQAAEAGPWRIIRRPPVNSLVAAYFTNGAPMPPDYWVLQKHGAVVMSLTPVELQSQGYHARLAKGKVLVAGLGLGAVVFNLLKNPAVTGITVCEKDPAIVGLLRQAAPWFDGAVSQGRVAIHIGDMFDYRPGPDEEYDTLLVDIWSGMGKPCAQLDVIRIQNNVGAAVVGWWGQELALVSWIYETYDQNRMPFRRDQTSAYERHLGFKLLGCQHQNYPSLLLAAVTNVMRPCTKCLKTGKKVNDQGTGSGGINVITVRPAL